ncbi:MAG: hypothetical protein ACOYWZ_14620 [Bacillota bacterium]
MAFSRKKNKVAKYIVISLAIVVLVSGSLLGGYYLYNRHIKSIKSSYEEQITELKLEQYNNKRRVYIPKSDIKCGTLLEESLFNESDIISSIPMDLFMTKEDMGRFARYDITAGIPAMKYMVIDEKIPDDLREEEFNMFLLQSNLTKDKFIDLRITFPNGEDYIVLSKKKIRDINIAQNTIWCWLNEKEMLTVSSAIVDAYLHKGTKLYTVTYVEPNSQKNSIPTYPAKLEVQKIMETDPNIVNRAKNALAEQMRTLLDQRLAMLNQEAVSNIQTGVNQEVAGRQEKIQQDNQNALQQGNQTSQTGQNTQTGQTNQTSQNNNSSGTTNEGGGDANGFFD